MKLVVEVREKATDKLVHTVKITGTQSQADQVERGMNINLDHARFYTRVGEPKAAKKLPRNRRGQG